MAKDKKRGRSPIPKPTSSGVSDFNIVGEDMVPAFDEDQPAEFTPITSIVDLGPAIGAIKRGQDRTTDAVKALDKTVREEVKPKLDTAIERTVNLSARAKSSEARLKVLETDSKNLAAGVGVHECNHEEDFREINENEKQVLLEIGTITSRVSVAETNIMAAANRTKEEVDKTDKRWSRFTAALITIGVAAFVGIIGWVVTLTTVSSDVRHLSGEQTKLRKAVSRGTTSVSNDAKRMENAATRVENAASAPAIIIEPPDPLGELWCDLSEREKSRQKRLRGGKIPLKRCQ